MKKSAILFENLNKGKIYLIFKEGSNEILAYFTLSISILRIIDPSVSKRTIKKLNGISKKKKEFPVYLIGQLGKNDRFWNNITGSEILQMAIDIICYANEFVGGRIILIETMDNEKLINFYKKNGFKILQTRIDKKFNRKSRKEVVENMFKCIEL